MSTLSSPFENATIAADPDKNLEVELLADEEGIEETTTGNGGLSAWKREASEQMNDPEDNGGGLSEWKTKRKRNGLKGRTPKHPLNKRPYTC